MQKPVWSLKDQHGNVVWSSFERDYLTVVEGALKHLGHELVRSDLEPCACCGQCQGACTCDHCETCG